MKIIKKIILVILFSQSAVFSKESIAPYILDGSLVIYTSTIEQAAGLWSTIMKKIDGIEYNNVRDRLGARITQKMSANMFQSISSWFGTALGENIV